MGIGVFPWLFYEWGEERVAGLALASKVRAAYMEPCLRITCLTSDCEGWGRPNVSVMAAIASLRKMFLPLIFSGSLDWSFSNVFSSFDKYREGCGRRKSILS